MQVHRLLVSVLQVFQQINRPNLRASYLYDLTIRDDTPLGSNERWVRYLQTGEPIPTLLHMLVPPGCRCPRLLVDKSRWSHIPHGTSWLPQAVPI